MPYYIKILSINYSLTKRNVNAATEYSQKNMARELNPGHI